ncbi:MAG: hypothetical protein CMM50_16425 [Rhodospirillaceae bacterium]|nr:hypothetical protein [Rhodospirillaceae bacterium]|tara:strand:+ start:169 stop:945 length:777 start_codon:yes stop_codon:yes gene_type:complete
MSGYVPYCGAAHPPGFLTWNLDPALVFILLAVAGLHVMHGTERSGRARTFAIAGWAIVGAAFLSPLCNLTVSLFSARVGQHMLLTLFAAPLIVLATDWRRIPWPVTLRRHGIAESIGATVAFMVLLWFWHMPAPYDATLRGDLAYWTMHVTMFGAALWLWRVLWGGTSVGMAGTALISLFTGIQMSILSAVLTLAPQALFEVHFGTTAPWGLSPLEDQQVGGLIMWVPAGLLLVGYAMVAFALEFRRMEARQSTMHAE